jgi:nucleoside-diphosphate-sugar epimerase
VHALVTGAAGFIGSHVAEALLVDGWEVRGVDAFTTSYDVARKRANVAPLCGSGRFALIEADLVRADLAPLLDGVDVVFHLAGEPGVRRSWADSFAIYSDRNVVATQRLLEGARRTAGLQRFVYASSSSVYGNALRYPTIETDLPAPHSPYGVTKLAAEHLCGLYGANWGVPTVSLRLFSVYGPRQRPDMAFHRLIECGLGGTAFELFGTGSQVRDFTFVGDVVEAHLLAATSSSSGLAPGRVLNVAGGGATSMSEAIDVVGSLLGRPVSVVRRPSSAGDVDRTGGSATLAASVLGWKPSVDLRDGLAAQVEWHQDRRL